MSVTSEDIMRLHMPEKVELSDFPLLKVKLLLTDTILPTSVGNRPTDISGVHRTASDIHRLGKRLVLFHGEKTSA